MRKNPKMYQKFIQAITWNSINLFLYKIILLLHQILLFKVIPKELYGLSGTLFATIYFMIGITGFGFDYTLLNLFANYNKSQELTQELIAKFITRAATVLCIAFVLCTILYSYNTYPIIAFFTKETPGSLFPYIFLIFISESLKKNVDSLSQLLFLNKQIAIVQIAMILSYVATVWTAFYLTGFITLHTIFIPMATISYIELLLMIVIIRSKYKVVVANKKFIASETYKYQLYNYGNQVSKNLFSPNFLMIYISYNLGLSQAGDIRFFTNIITLLHMFFNRVIGMPSAAMLAQAKKESLAKIKNVFLTITNNYIQLLYVTGLLTLAIILPQLNNSFLYIHILLFIVIGFIEYITLTYEKFFIIQKESKLLAKINGISFIVLVTILATVPTHPKFLLLPIFAIRLLSTLLIGYSSYKKWNLLPSFKPHKIVFFLTMFLVILFLNY